MLKKFIHNIKNNKTDEVNKVIDGSLVAKNDLLDTLNIELSPRIKDNSNEIVINDIADQNDDSESIVIEKPMSSGSHISEYLYSETRNKIKKTLNKTIEFDIADTIRWRFIWRKGGNITEALALLTSLISTVLSFSAGVFDYTYLAFAAGCLGSISLALLRATSYAMKESKEREEQLNILLSKAKIRQVPSLIHDEDP